MFPFITDNICFAGTDGDVNKTNIFVKGALLEYVLVLIYFRFVIDAKDFLYSHVWSYLVDAANRRWIVESEDKS